MCNERETYIRKATGDNTNEFKVRINQHISDCKTGFQHVSCCIMIRLNKSDRCENIEKHLKDYDTMNNPGRN